MRVWPDLAFDLGLGGSLHREGETSVAGVLGVDAESVVLVGATLFQGRTLDLDPAGVANVLRVHHDLTEEIKKRCHEIQLSLHSMENPRNLGLLSCFLFE